MNTINHKIIRVMEHELGKARAKLKAARADVNMFGMYDDCGPSYESDYHSTKAVVDYLEQLLPTLREHIKPKKEVTNEL